MLPHTVSQEMEQQVGSRVHTCASHRASEQPVPPFAPQQSLPGTPPPQTVQRMCAACTHSRSQFEEQHDGSSEQTRPAQSRS